MSVPLEDVLCRFVRLCDWHQKENRPKSKAFKQINYSAWDSTCLQRQGAQIEDLQIEQLKECGLSCHSVQDYHDIAATMAKMTRKPYEVAVEWAPDNVPPQWEQWKHAHVRVDTPDGKLLPKFFRDQLVLRSRVNVQPAALADSESI